jgi:hypothetical protein
VICGKDVTKEEKEKQRKGKEKQGTNNEWGGPG